MARISGLERKQAPWHLRWFYRVMRKDLFARLRQHYSEEQLLELGAHIAFENYRARYNRRFDVESDGLYTTAELSRAAGV